MDQLNFWFQSIQHWSILVFFFPFPVSQQKAAIFGLGLQNAGGKHPLSKKTEATEPRNAYGPIFGFRGQIYDRKPQKVAVWKGNGTPYFGGSLQLVTYYRIWPDLDSMPMVLEKGPCDFCGRSPRVFSWFGKKGGFINQSMNSWNSKQPVFYGCFNWMIPNLSIKNGCSTKHPLKDGCLVYQVEIAPFWKQVELLDPNVVHSAQQRGHWPLGLSKWSLEDNFPVGMVTFPGTC